MIDPVTIVAVLFAGLVPIVLSLTLFYRVVLGEHPIVVRSRRSVVGRDHWRWPFRDPLPGMLPIGLGIELVALGRFLSGQIVSFDRLPADPVQYVSLIGLAIILIGCWFMIRPPRWVLPAWYREVRDRRKTVSSASLVAAVQIRADLEALGADLSEAMAQATALREGRSHDAAWPAIGAAAEAERKATNLVDRIDDDRLFELVAGWKRTFDATPKGGPVDLLTSVSTGASDAEWQLLATAAAEALAHIESVVDAMGRTIPRI